MNQYNNRNDQYNDMIKYDEAHHGDLIEVSAYCSRFERRYDFDTFSMSDYQACENCRHLGADDRCIVKR
ncbi:MAG: hypothetical protein RR769_05830 [Anaerovoracaceae bacterium]